jgi:hypothetical protein
MPIRLEFLDTQVYSNLLPALLSSSTSKNIRNEKNRGDSRTSRLSEVYGTLASEYRGAKVISNSSEDRAKEYS